MTSTTDRRYIRAPDVINTRPTHVVTKALINEVIEEIDQRKRDARIAELEVELVVEARITACIERYVAWCKGMREMAQTWAGVTT